MIHAIVCSPVFMSGRRHIPIRPEDVHDRDGVASRQALELAGRHGARVALDPALAAAEWDVDDRALPGHPGGECTHLVWIDVHVEAYASLARSAQRVVLYAVASEDLNPAIVH